MLSVFVSGSEETDSSDERPRDDRGRKRPSAQRKASEETRPADYDLELLACRTLRNLICC